MTSTLLFVVSLCLSSGIVSGLSPAQWRQQSIYQVVTDRFARTDGSTTAPCDLNEYCGGTWRGIINRLDYIQNMGFTAIWISPIVKNFVASTKDGNSYHGYWAQDLYSLNDSFGTSEDLKALSAELHSRGMYLMLDVVPNHFGSFSSRATVDYSSFNPLNQQSYFHIPCEIDYNNPNTVETCWLGSDTVSLPDVKTEDPVVSYLLGQWINRMVSEYSVDGLRIDTARQVNKEFWSGFQNAAGGLHVLAEVWNGSPNELCPYQNYLTGLMNYATYYWTIQSFQNSSQSLATLANNINWVKAKCADTTLLGSFLENHDNPRFPSFTSDSGRIKTAIAFSILADGIPIVYQGQEQAFSGSTIPTNREALWTSGYNQNSDLYKHIQMLNAIRSRAIYIDDAYLTYKADPIYADASTIALRKGEAGAAIVSVYTNRGSNSGGSTMTLAASRTGYSANTDLVEVLSCATLRVDSRGNLGVTVSNGLPGVYYPRQKLIGSGLCGL